LSIIYSLNNNFMKKLLLGTCALLGTAGMAQANVLTVNNLTACTYEATMTGYGAIATIPPGISTFTSLAGFDISSFKIIYMSGGTGLASCSVGLGYMSSNTMGQPTPPCLPPGAYFSAAWAQATSTANATAIIF
jgi:hypothetical protein